MNNPRVRPIGASPRMAFMAFGFALALLGAPAVAMAHFVDEDSASLSVSTATLQPPTAADTSPGACTEAGDATVVTWTRSSSSQVAGYEILRSTVGGGPYSPVGIAAGQATESYTDSPLAFSTTYYYVIRATREGWRSVNTAEVSRTTRSSLCV